MCCSYHRNDQRKTRSSQFLFFISSILKFKKSLIPNSHLFATTIEPRIHTFSYFSFQNVTRFSTSSFFFYKFTEKFHHCVYSFSLVSADFNHQSFDHLKYIKFAYKCYHFSHPSIFLFFLTFLGCFSIFFNHFVFFESIDFHLFMMMMHAFDPIIFFNFSLFFFD